MVNVAIKEGWASGPWHSQQFREALKAAGYNVTEPEHADVLIAHSTGCYDINPKSAVQLYILINPPYWPGKSITNLLLSGKVTPRQVRHDQPLWRDIFWKAKYAASRWSVAQNTFKQTAGLDFLINLKEKPVYVVRNQDDHLSSPEIEVALHGHPNVRFVKLPGGHDDYYANPQPYIALLPKAI